jgi:hypothetical protein
MVKDKRNVRWAIVLLLPALNMLRGHGLLSRGIMYAIIMAYTWYAFDVQYATIWTLGIAFFLAFPWGNGFAIFGKDDRVYTRSDKWLVKLVDKLTDEVPKLPGSWAMPKHRAVLWGIGYMAFRGCWLIPSFIAVGYTHNVYAWALVPICPLIMVFSYYYGNAIAQKLGVGVWNVRVSEGLLGLALGVCIVALY